MNKYVKEQLSKVKVADLPNYDDSTQRMFIPKQQGSSGKFLESGKYYLIKVDDYICNPPEGFTMHDNWNGGIVPKYNHMKIDVNVIMGKMVKITGVGYDMVNRLDTNYVWQGWLPIESIKILEVIG